MDKCFICLDKTNARFCHNCKLFTHRACKGKYLNKNKRLITIITDKIIKVVSREIHCPQCKRYISTPMITRNDRNKMLNNTVNNIVIKEIVKELDLGIENDDSFNYNYLYTMVNILQRCKKYVKDSKLIKIKCRLMCFADDKKLLELEQIINNL